MSELKRARLSRRAFFKTVGRLGLAAIGASALGAAYASLIEPFWLVVERLTLTLPYLPRAFHGLTITQISDLHFGPVVPMWHIRNAIDTVLGLRSEVVVVTGDFVSRINNGEAERVTQEVSRLTAPQGVFAILGNHDWWTNSVIVSQAVEQTGLTLLRNNHVALQRGGETFYIAGVDDVWEEQANLPQAMDGIPMKVTTLLLAHEPDFADVAAQDERIAVQLSGHSHGGQVVPPFGQPIALPYLSHKYPIGYRRVGELQLYTNRGIGMAGLPVRFNCRPEITVFTLQSGFDTSQVEMVLGGEYECGVYACIEWDECFECQGCFIKIALKVKNKMKRKKL